MASEKLYKSLSDIPQNVKMPEDVVQDVPVYRLTAPMFGDDRTLHEKWEIIEYTGEPNTGMFPLNELALKTMRSYLDKLDGLTEERRALDKEMIKLGVPINPNMYVLHRKNFEMLWQDCHNFAAKNRCSIIAAIDRQKPILGLTNISTPSIRKITLRSVSAGMQSVTPPTALDFSGGKAETALSMFDNAAGIPAA
jgi:hypothetical protein